MGYSSLTTDTNALKNQGSNNYSVKNVTVSDGEDCKICVQLFKVNISNGSRSGSVKLTDVEAAELSKIISFDTGS